LIILSRGWHVTFFLSGIRGGGEKRARILLMCWCFQNKRINFSIKIFLRNFLVLVIHRLQKIWQQICREYLSKNECTTKNGTQNWGRAEKLQQKENLS
ncbi:MAG: hypothetical protein RSB25_17900, partial [Acinetobacter sp.]